MADDDSTQQLDPTALYQQIVSGLQTPTTQDEGPPTKRSFTSLLGEMLSGGSGPGLTSSQAETEGNRSLLNFGLNMLAASGPSQVRRGFGQIFASGLAGAEQSAQGYEAQIADWQQKQQQMQIERLKALEPLMNTAIALRKMNIMTDPRYSLFGQGTGTTGTTGAAPSSGNLAVLARDAKTYETAGQQANNPGNIMAVNGSTVFPGAVGQVPVAGGRSVVAFPDIPTGVAAMSDNLTSYANQGITTVADAVRRWVGDPKADLTTYIADVAKRIGVAPDAKIDLTDPKVQSAFFAAQQPHETGGKTQWLSQADIDAGIAMAQARRKGQPTPTTVATTTPQAPAPTPPAPQATAKAEPQAPKPMPPPGNLSMDADSTSPNWGDVAAMVPEDAAAQAKFVAHLTGKPVPVEGGQGLIAYPDGRVGPPPGGGFPPPKAVSSALPVPPIPPEQQQVQRDVAALQSGVQEAQATPIVPGTGLATGPSSVGQSAQVGTLVPLSQAVPGMGRAAPAPPPAPAATPPAPVPMTTKLVAATPGEVPDNFEDYKRSHIDYLTPSDDQRALWNQSPDQAQLTNIQHQAQIAQQRIAQADAAGRRAEMMDDAAGVNAASQAKAQAQADLGNWLEKENTLRQQAAKQGSDAQSKWLEDRTKELHDDWSNAIKAKNDISVDAAKADTAFNSKRRDTYAAAADAARSSLTDLSMLRALSDTVGKVDPWTQMEVGGHKMQDWVTSVLSDWYSPAYVAKMGNQQAYEAAVNKIIIGLRSGVSMGQLSDRDLSFLSAQAPSLLQDPKTRGNIIGFLSQIYQRRVDLANKIDEYYQPGKVSVSEALKRADADLGPIIPQMKVPQGASDDEKERWIYQNATPGSFYKDESGKLQPYNPPRGWVPRSMRGQ